MTARRVALAGILVVLACEPIVGEPLTPAPLNACPDHPCEAYQGGVKANCQNGRCELAGSLSAYTAVVSLPQTSFFAPGATFMLDSKQLAQDGVLPLLRCSWPTCLPLPDVAIVSGTYKVTAKAAQLVGLKTPGDLPSVPSRVTFLPLTAPGAEAYPQGLPAVIGFTSSRVVRGGVRYQTELARGTASESARYLRYELPEPPWDKYFPPLLDEIDLPGGSDPVTSDDFQLDTNTLDDSSVAGTARLATITRAEGLDGFGVWIAQHTTGRRVSVLRPLAGTSMQVRLDTHGQSACDPGCIAEHPDEMPSSCPTTALCDARDLVVAPPNDWIAVPTFRAQITAAGSTLGNFAYPTLSPPLEQNGGVVRVDASGAPLGIPSRITFTSQTITLADGTPEPKLHYTTTVSTDSAGYFFTVLPPGSYSVLIDPAEGTGSARTLRTATFETAKALQGMRFEIDPLAHVAGRAHIADGRALAGARVSATPLDAQALAQSDAPPTAASPRAAETTTDDVGAFHLDLDPGGYELSVEPEPGTGLPRVVTVAQVSPGSADLPDTIIPAPFKLAFTLRAAGESAPPVPGAVVRIYVSCQDSLVEAGLAVTDEGGKCEILLADCPLRR
ncbi:MAG TPA: hypothetical protein VIF62_11835 [Labilithrix sp.]